MYYTEGKSTLNKNNEIDKHKNKNLDLICLYI